MVSEESKRIMITLSDTNAQKLDELAKRMGLSKSALVTIWINANVQK